jgi:hypothetical protein
MTDMVSAKTFRPSSAEKQALPYSFAMERSLFSYMIVKDTEVNKSGYRKDGHFSFFYDKNFDIIYTRWDSTMLY